MKYCVSINLTYNYLSKADEIKLFYKDINGITKYSETYPQASFILLVNPEDEVNWEELKRINIITKGKLYISVMSMNHFEKAKENGIKAFFDQEINTFYQLEALIKCGVAYIRLGAPLFFQLDKVRKMTDIPIRAVANVAYRDFLKRDNGIFGTWIRPEDVEAYDDYITTIEFENCTIEKEEALFRIYSEEAKWPGQLDMIIDKLNFSCENRMISSEFSRARLTCRQRCKETGMCSICKRMMMLANAEMIENYRTTVLEQK